MESMRPFASEMHHRPSCLVRSMVDIATRLGVTVRWERGSFKGGVCKIRGAPVVVLNKGRPAEMHLAILAEALRDLPLESVYIRPAVREDIKVLLAKV